jgi:hypothetical protein
MSEHSDPPKPPPTESPPTEPPEPATPGESAEPLARERARRRMLALAQLCVVAAAPVTNTACDPAPEPYCAESTDADRSASLYADAAWVDDGGTLLVSLELGVSSAYPLSLGDTFSVFGGTLEQTTTQGSGVALRILPDDGTTQIRVLGSLLCDGMSSPFDVFLDVSATAQAGAEIPTTIQ